MTTNFLQFSQVIPNLTDDEVAWFVKYIEHRSQGLDLEGNEQDFDDDGVYPDFGFQIMESKEWGRYAWFFSHESANIAQLAETVQEYLKKFHPESSFSMTWADYANQLVPSQFDGGAVFVTKDDIRLFHAGQWAREQEMSFLGHIPDESTRPLVIPAKP